MILFWTSLKICCLGKSLPDDRIPALSALEALADDNFIVAQVVQFSSDWEENIVSIGENDVTSISPFPTIFSTLLKTVYPFPTMFSRHIFQGC